MGKTAEVLIDGEVSNYSYMASIAGVRDQLAWQGQFDDIRVVINSNGGDIAEGLGMYDQLRSYEVPITTVVIGQCCSAATIVFLAGKTRLIYENVVAFMVHQAQGGGSGSADELRTIADFIDSYNERMAKIYMEATGKDAEIVAEWMAKDTFMTAEEALTNGFATGIAKPVTAKYIATAPPTPSTNQSSITAMKIIKDKWARMSASVTALLEGKKIVAKDVTTDAGETLTIETADGGDNYAEGDVVKKGADPAPDGTYKVGNVTIVVKDGKIESLKSEESAEPATAASNADVVTAEGETPTGDDSDTIATLKAENETLKTEVAGLKSTMGTVTAKMTMLLGMKESPDVAIPAPKPQNKSVTARASVLSDEEQERQEMLDKRIARGQDKPAEK